MDPVKSVSDFSKTKVFVSPDLEDLIPGFLQNRERDVKRLEAGLCTRDFDLIRTIGHDMKGTGGGYGFPGMSVIGGKLEEAALKSNLSVIEAEIKKFKNYLSSLEVIYSEKSQREAM